MSSMKDNYANPEAACSHYHGRAKHLLQQLVEEVGDGSDLSANLAAAGRSLSWVDAEKFQILVRELAHVLDEVRLGDFNPECFEDDEEGQE